MIDRTRRKAWIAGMVIISLCGYGCTAYRPLTRPVPKLSVLSPDLGKSPEEQMEKMLRAGVKPEFPIVVAVAKVENPYPEYVYEEHPANQYALASISGEEADGWRNMTDKPGRLHPILVRQVRFISPALMTGNPTLLNLRNAAAQMHAPLLLVYIQQDGASDGYKGGTYTIGYDSACQAALVDTRTGIILATAESDARGEQKAFPLGAGSAKERLQDQTRAQAVAGVQKNFMRALIELEK